MTLALAPGRGIRFLHAWYPLAIFIPAFEETARLSHMIVHQWQDVYLLRFEAWLFSVPPTVWLGQFATPWLTELLEFGYFSYYLLMIIVGGALYRIGNRLAFARLMSASVLAYVICYMMFIAIPMEGPRHTLRALHTVELTGGPFHWAVSTLQSNAGVHGNAFPSAHVANALVCLIMALVYVRSLGLALIPPIFLLCVGAIYDRYHYFSDVIAGAMLGLVVALFILRLPDTFFSERALQ
jgi:membrane-associated phospholipid phosphatase